MVGSVNEQNVGVKKIKRIDYMPIKSEAFNLLLS